MKILIFIPAFNCEKQIIRVLEQFNSDLGNCIDEILIIDNASQDNTLNVTCEAAKKLPLNIRVQKNKQNYGYGGSIKIAINYAIENQFDYILILHGDDQARIADFQDILISKEFQHFGAMFGARFHPQSRLEGYSRFRIFGNWVLNRLCGILARCKIYDLGSGMNIYKVDKLKEINYLSYEDNLNYTANLHLNIIKENWKIKYHPISWHELDQVSNAKIFRQAFSILWLYSIHNFISYSKKPTTNLVYASDVKYG